MVVTLGFRDDPHFDLLDESQWQLVVELDEERALDETRLIAESFGWVTIFQPPWFGAEIEKTAWLVLQWHEDEEGKESERARRRLSLAEVIDVVPARFQDWAIETTSEALSQMADLVPEISAEGGLDIDNGAALLGRVSSLREQVAEAEEQKKKKERKRERLYGDIYLYDFAPETDLEWRVGSLGDDTDALIVRPDGEKSDRRARVLIPPSELSEWRWTSPNRPSDGGEYLSPSEVLARVPSQFHAWVAAKTHEALQQVRHALYELTDGTVANGDDLARVVRLARHAQDLASFSRRPGPEILDLLEEEGEDALVGHALSPDGRLAVLAATSWKHILEGHPEMEDHLDDVIETVENPEHREPDPRVGRERFFRQGGPETWIRVVVEADELIERVVTAFPQTNAPDRRRPM